MSIFEAAGISDPLGLWDTSPQILSFGIEDEANAPVYRVNLPESLAASSSALAGQLASFERLQAALKAVPSQLDGLQRRAQAAASGVSFAVSGAAPESGPEGELLALLAEADSTALRETAPDGLSFGGSEVMSAALGQAKDKFGALLEQVNQDILHFAWVETKIEDLIIARTKVGWSGDSTTLLHGLTTEEHTFLHRQTLEVVSRTRNLKLQMLLTISGGAAKVAVLMASPGGPMLALPAVYQYVMKILDQAKQIQSLQSS
jgi:hypothetical protein